MFGADQHYSAVWRDVAGRFPAGIARAFRTTVRNSAKVVLVVYYSCLTLRLPRRQALSPALSPAGQEDTVKTALIDGTQPATFDATLFIAIDLIPARPQLVWMESILIGIRNEYGDIYRVIGVTGMSSFVDVTAKLRELGYRDEALAACDAAQGFDAIVSAPNLC